MGKTFTRHDEVRLIKGAAEVLLSAFRSSDVVARIGGDEFAVLLSRTDHDAVVAAIQRVKNCETDPKLGNFARSLSLGAATAAHPDELLDSMKLADRLMYKDKAERKARHLNSATKA